MNRSLAVLIASALLIFPIFSTSFAQISYRGLDGGIAIPEGDGSSLWKTGFSINYRAYYKINSYISAGARIGYHRWTPDKDAVLTTVPGIPSSVRESGDVSGRTIILEFSPSFQIYPLHNEAQVVKPFIQGSFGVFYLDGDVTINGIWIDAGDPDNPTAWEGSAADQVTKPGTNFGAGLRYSFTEETSIEFVALYHIIFTDDETTRYFTLTAGFWF